jgi:hypothetical protein
LENHEDCVARRDLGELVSWDCSSPHTDIRYVRITIPTSIKFARCFFLIYNRFARDGPRSLSEHDSDLQCFLGPEFVYRSSSSIACVAALPIRRDNKTSESRFRYPAYFNLKIRVPSLLHMLIMTAHPQMFASSWTSLYLLLIFNLFPSVIVGLFFHNGFLS